jgi:hypothetical protein
VAVDIGSRVARGSSRSIQHGRSHSTVGSSSNSRFPGGATRGAPAKRHSNSSQTVRPSLRRGLAVANSPQTSETGSKFHVTERKAMGLGEQKPKLLGNEEERPGLYVSLLTNSTPTRLLISPGSFINKVSNAYQTEEPPQYHEGIIADPMGLGKTLTMIALIATDLQGYSYGESTSGRALDSAACSKATLIIVPPPRRYLVLASLIVRLSDIFDIL